MFALYTYIYSPNLSFQWTRAPNRFYHKTFLSVIASLAGRKSEMTIITHSLDMYRESSELYDQLQESYVFCFLTMNIYVIYILAKYEIIAILSTRIF